MTAKIPHFDSYEAAAEFWDTHDFSDYVEDTEPVEFEVTLRRDSPSGLIPVLEQEARVCPIDGSELLRVVIDYSNWSGNHLLIVRRVQILECDKVGHRFIAPAMARQIEDIFQRDHKGELAPEATMMVPVVTLKAAA